MSSYELGYFNLKANAEISRYVLALGGAEYKDTRFDQAEWEAKYKATTPSGHCPFLLVDDHMIVESSAINRYLSKQFGLMGSTDLEEAFIDQTYGIISDTFTKLIRVFKDEFSTEEEKVKATKELHEEVIPQFHSYLEKNLKPSGFLLDKVSLADVAAYYFLESSYTGEAESTPEKVKEFYKKFSDIPKIKTWRSERPITEY